MSRRIEFIFFSGCPHAAAARTNLRTALDAAGLPAIWQEWNQEHSGIPRQALGYGSPTILVDGRDVTGGEPGAAAGPGAAAALSCRADGVPSISTIRHALED